MRIAVKPLFGLALGLALLVPGGCAQTPQIPTTNPSSTALSPDLMRRVEILIRSRASIPPDYDVLIGSRTKSDLPGFDAISVTFQKDGKSSRPMQFYLSADGKTLAQFNKFDISQDPKALIDPGTRPGRGGPANAPVLIVSFDDLECPYCARMHEQLFPALLDRYKNQVHIVYKDFPLVEIHPWAMHAAIDVNCVGDHSTTGYWNLVDYIHAHAGEMGGAEKTVAKADQTLDQLTMDEGKRQHLDEAGLKACVAKQDETPVRASMKEGEALGVDATPAMYINGEKLEGALPIEDVYRMIDGALLAAGKTPPPPPVPTEPASAAPGTAASPAKTGN